LGGRRRLRAASGAPGAFEAEARLEEAPGGGDEPIRLEGLLALTLEGRGIAYRLGQNRNPDTDLPTSEVSAFKRCATP